MLKFTTNRPQALLNAFDKMIKDGDVQTWAKDSGGDFSHKAQQWKNRAWLRPNVISGQALEFRILFAKTETQKRLVYSYYHGHMLETFLNHLWSQYSQAEASPQPSGSDSAV